MVDKKGKNSEKEKEPEMKEFEWTPYAELRLLHAMYGLKPIGVSYHFLMLIIWEKFKETMGINVPLKIVKEKISTWYDLKAADEIFPDDDFSEEEFSLPIDEFPQIVTVESSKPVETNSKKRKH
ncbi:MRG/MORF4L-binding protein [Halyomorpha halys]|uniref:MRG/MORF4L-binding protein n=1 Tax=Halyomorpha halys TaxID=286706 RepID=UPI0034D242EA